MAATCSTKATIHLHGPGGITEAMTVHLPGPVLKLLRTLDKLQRRQAGEDVQSLSDDAPAVACLERMAPAEVEACIAGGVKAVNAALWMDGQEVLLLGQREALVVRTWRRRLREEAKRVLTGVKRGA